MGQLGAVYAIWLREVKRALRDRGRLIGGLSTGLDRLGLSRLLRAANAQIEILPSAEALTERHALGPHRSRRLN